MTARGSSTKSSWAIGGMIFAATMMLMIGVFQVLMGIAAIARHTFFVGPHAYLYRVNVTGWGWIHLILGVLMLIAGIGLFQAATWARVIGIGLAGLAAINNFLFLPYYPFWALLLIAMDIFVIWALAAAGKQVQQETAWVS